nr:hypothetical protein CFP56_74079 [Quercus suber]
MWKPYPSYLTRPTLSLITLTLHFHSLKDSKVQTSPPPQSTPYFSVLTLSTLSHCRRLPSPPSHAGLISAFHLPRRLDLGLSSPTMNETREIPEGQHNEADQGVTNVHKDKGKPPLPPSAELVSDAALTTELGMSTPTLIEVDS